MFALSPMRHCLSSTWDAVRVAMCADCCLGGHVYRSGGHVYGVVRCPPPPLQPPPTTIIIHMLCTHMSHMSLDALPHTQGVRNLMDPTTAVDPTGQDLALVLLEDDQGAPVFEDGEPEPGFVDHVLALPHAHLRQLVVTASLYKPLPQCTCNWCWYRAAVVLVRFSRTNMPRRMGLPAHDVWNLNPLSHATCPKSIQVLPLLGSIRACAFHSDCVLLRPMASAQQLNV